MTERVQTSGAPSRTFEVTIGGKYRIESLIGEGGFARVYKARHAKIRQLVFAIKILRKAQVEDESQIERFVREAEMSATIQTPYAVRVTDFGETRQGLPYIVMEYVKGRTLHDWTQKFGAPDDRFAAQIALCILRALEEAHARGIVHRDLKPSNIMILDEPSDDGIVAKVTDFGIAKVISSTQAGMDESPPTTGGLVFCTPQYASPEVLMGNPTFQSDLYALGHTLAEMLDGSSPYAGWGSFEIANRQMAPEPSVFGAGTNRSALAPIIARACAKDLELRYADATAMARDVEKLLSRLDRTTAVDPPAVVGALNDAAAGPSDDAPTNAILGLKHLSQLSSRSDDAETPKAKAESGELPIKPAESDSARTLLTMGKLPPVPEDDPLAVVAPRPNRRLQTTLQPTIGPAAAAIDESDPATRVTSVQTGNRWNTYWIVGATIACTLIIVAALWNTNRDSGQTVPAGQEQEALVAAAVDELARRMDDFERDRVQIVGIQTGMAEARLAVTMALQAARANVLNVQSSAAVAESSAASAALLTTLRAQQFATALAEREAAQAARRAAAARAQRYRPAANDRQAAGTDGEDEETTATTAPDRLESPTNAAAETPATATGTDEEAESEDSPRRRRVRFPLVLE
jgi:serine/threonine protein kinase